MIEPGKKVSIKYTVTLADGSVVDKNPEDMPLTFEQGSHEILEPLEKCISEREVGDSFEAVFSPKEAYGDVKKDAFQAIELHLVPEESRTPGAALTVEDEAGQRHLLRVHEIKGDTIILDFNHPLAGHTLKYNVEIIDIE